MSQPYTIADQRSLDHAIRRGPHGLNGKSRTTDELPKAFAHQVLVYRVDGRYRIDDADGLGPAHDDVVNATHVSVVDVSRDRPVPVELDIPSQDALDFRVRVTFVCTVTDPLVVVRKGLYDAESALLGYLKRHHKIVQLGLEYQVTQINSVRR